MNHVEFHINQNIGVGQGYFIEENAPGIDALVELENTGHAILRLVITRFNFPEITVDVLPKSEYAIEVANIQTVGILVLPGPTDGKGRLIITWIID
jgi:hypothetical protein